MSNYKLIYFNSRGRAENARMMFTIRGQKFEDVRVEFEKWQEYKPCEYKCIHYLDHTVLCCS